MIVWVELELLAHLPLHTVEGVVIDTSYAEKRHGSRPVGVAGYKMVVFHCRNIHCWVPECPTLAAVMT